MPRDFSDYRTLSFDCYGTLIDWETGIEVELGPWAARHELESEAVLASFGQVETQVQQESPQMRYPEVLAEAFRRIGRGLRIEVGDDEVEEFGGSVGRWPPFPDSAQALKELKAGFRLAILSNVDRTSFSLSNEKLGVEFDLVVTAEDVGSYKPDRRNFLALFERLPSIGGERSSLLHVAQSLFHDHEPALALELETVWIDRRAERGGSGATPPPSVAVTPTWTFPSMAAFAAAIDSL